MAFYSPDNVPYPIQDLLDGELNKRMSKKVDNKYFPCKFYTSEEEAAQSLYKMTRPGNLKAAYIVELGVDVKEAKDFIRKGQFNLIIIKAINYKDRQKKLYIKKNNPTREHEIKVEVIENPNFNPSIIQSPSEHESKPFLASFSNSAMGDVPVQSARELDQAPA